MPLFGSCFKLYGQGSSLLQVDTEASCRVNYAQVRGKSIPDRRNKMCKDLETETSQGYLRAGKKGQRN